MVHENDSISIAYAEAKNYAQNIYVFMLTLDVRLDSSTLQSIFPALEQIYDSFKTYETHIANVHSQVDNTKVICEYDTATEKMHIYATENIRTMARVLWTF